MGGIMKAMESNKSSWMILGCDYPFLNLDAVACLIENRNEKAYATCYIDPKSGYVIPTCAIYEPRIYNKFQEAVREKEYGLYKLVKTLNVELVEAKGNWILGVNTIEEYNSVIKDLNN